MNSLINILPLSSVGTSMRLLTAVSWVRVPEGQPYVHLAQLDRVPPYEGVCREFESLNGRQGIIKVKKLFAVMCLNKDTRGNRIYREVV